MAKAQKPMDEIAGSSVEKKQLKILITGPRGQYKTRSILNMCNVPNDKEPILSIIDTENGSDHYGGEFRFRRFRSSDSDEISEYVESKIKNPLGIEVIALDSHTIYFDAVKSKYADLYLKRMPTSSGHKGEFYIFQPNDHAPYRKEIYDFMRACLSSPFHFIWTCHSTSRWSGMKVIGEKPDGVKGIEHWFDTVINISEKSNGTFVAKVEKDRTGLLIERKVYPWRSQEDAFALFEPFRALLHGEKLPEKKKEVIKEEKKKEPIEETAGERAKPEEKKKEPEQVNPPATIKIMLMEVVKLKKELRIVEKADWDKLVKPFNVDSAKDMTVIQLTAFIKQLTDMRPTSEEEDKIPF